MNSLYNILYTVYIIYIVKKKSLKNGQMTAKQKL